MRRLRRLLDSLAIIWILVAAYATWIGNGAAVVWSLVAALGAVLGAGVCYWLEGRNKKAREAVDRDVGNKPQ
jgi:hypothetical protein